MNNKKRLRESVLTAGEEPARADSGFPLIPGIGAGLAAFGGLLAGFGIPPLDYLKFLAGLLLFTYLPGRALLRLLRVRSAGLENLVLSLAGGMAVTTVVNKFTRWFHGEALFWVWVGFGLASFIYLVVKSPRPRSKARFRITSTGLSLGLIMVLALGTLAVDNYRNARKQADGSRVINLHYYDGFYRIAVTRELSHTVPPRVPAVADLPLGYHYGMDLYAAMFNRYLGLDVFDLHHRFLISFFFLLLILALFVFIRELTSSEKAAALGAGLALFGSGGLAYLVTWLQGLNQWGNLFFSFYFFNITTVNSFLPGLGILLAGWTALIRWVRTREAGWLLTAALLLALSMEFKQFFIGPIIGALFLSGMIRRLTARDSSLLRAWILTTLFALPLLLAAFIHNTGAIPYQFRLRFVDWVIFSLQKIEPDLIFLTWKGVVQHGLVTPLNLLLSAAGLLIFLLGAFGLSLFALPATVGEFFRFQRTPAERHVLITFFGGCVLYFFVIQLVLGGRPRNFVNIYAFFLAVVWLTIFFAEKLALFARRRRPLVRAAVIGLVCLAAIPNSLRYLRIKVLDPQPRIFSAAFLETADWVSGNTPPESVILHPLGLRYACYFSDRRVVLDNSSHSYITFHLTAPQIEKRTGEIDAFFEAPDLRAALLDRSRVDFVWTWNEPGGAGAWASGEEISGFTDLGTRDVRKFRRSHTLTPVFSNSEFRVYRVDRTAEGEICVLEGEGADRRWVPFEQYRRRR